jgi:tetratricopeptide (TPR) repeat protein
VDNRGGEHHSTGMSEGKSEPGFAEVERRALALEAEGRLKEAAKEFDAALKLNPASQSAVEGRARIALALKEDDAADHCLRALAFHNADPDLQLRMIMTAAT